MACATPLWSWDLFCRVIDYYGDAGVCWRLARALVEHGQGPVRLWIDVPAVLQKLVPQARPGECCEGVQIEAWGNDDPRLTQPDPKEIAQVVIGAFACEPPPGYRQAMAHSRPVWINLEYLSAEEWVGGHHRLGSPKPDGLVEHFFFPGFDDATGGLLREAGLATQRRNFGPAEQASFLASLGVELQPSVRRALLFCYPEADARSLLDAFARQPEPWQVLLPEGIAPGLAEHPAALPIPFVPQRDFDLLLWSCDLNFIRGEDSLVRALWAGKPLVWQAYRQEDNARLPKLAAFLARFHQDAALPPPVWASWQALHACWNGDPAVSDRPLTGPLSEMLSALPELTAGAHRWRDKMEDKPDLVARLVEFVRKTL